VLVGLALKRRKDMGNWVTRLYDEHDELVSRIKKLEKFILSKDFDELLEIDRIDLKKQLTYIRLYTDVLSRRLARTASGA